MRLPTIALAILILSFISLVLSPSAFAQPRDLQAELEYKKMIDKCPIPPSKEYIQNWSCGNWEIDHNEVRRVFRMTINEHAQIDVGAPNGEKFAGWTFNGTIPGPTLRMTAGDLVTVYVTNPDNSTRPHSFHKHSIHNSVFDGAGLNRTLHFINPGQTGQYLFTAAPYGVYPYHCHVDPIADHVNRGLYGVLIIDPPTPRPPANEMIMLMNGYDFNYDQEGGTVIEMPEHENVTEEVEVGEKESEDEEDSNDDDGSDEAPEESEEESEEVQAEVEEEERDNEIYTVNGYAFEYMHHPININLGEKQRIYLVNMLEFDLINSFHLHANMFNYSSSGTYLSDQNQITTDILTLGQGDRGILEFTPPYVGTFMIHAHVTEFTDLGWMGFLQVNKPR
jgi:FtsP/CotA-like multicopper oxidase with cupredoxin domain